MLTDSYKASHFLMYPEADLMVAYGEFRGNFQKDPNDSRFVFYGSDGSDNRRLRASRMPAAVEVELSCSCT